MPVPIESPFATLARVYGDTQPEGSFAEPESPPEPLKLQFRPSELAKRLFSDAKQRRVHQPTSSPSSAAASSSTCASASSRHRNRLKFPDSTPKKMDPAKQYLRYSPGGVVHDLRKIQQPKAKRSSASKRAKRIVEPKPSNSEEISDSDLDE